MLPIPGARYKSALSGDDLYYFKPSCYWNATKQISLASIYAGEVNFERPLSPSRIPLEVLTTAVVRAYGSTPLMGTDPEFFLETPTGMRLPAWQVLEDKHSGQDLFWDGFQAETKVSPSVNHRHIVANFAKQMALLRPLRLRMAPITCWRIPNELLSNASEAQVALGCDPSYNIYDLHGSCVPEPRKLLWRFAGGHLHFGLMEREKESETYRRMVKSLDLILGVASVAMAAGWDLPVRRRYYGLAGEFRLPPHGLEYRTLSNWYWMHPQSAMLILDLARHAANIGRAGLGRAFHGTPQQVIQIINYSDVRGARELCALNRDFYHAWAEREYGKSGPFFKALMGGIGAALPDFGRMPDEAWKKVEDPWHLPLWSEVQ